MKLYVASKVENAPAVRELMGILVYHGHSISFDWTQETFNENCELVKAQKHAALCLAGVLSCDCLVVLAEKDFQYSGTLVEMGMAIASEKPVVILGDRIDKCLFQFSKFVDRVATRYDLLMLLRATQKFAVDCSHCGRMHKHEFYYRNRMQECPVCSEQNYEPIDYTRHSLAR
jgi:nucleoside 2-deoxyribosyltransferase